MPYNNYILLYLTVALNQFYCIICQVKVANKKQPSQDSCQYLKLNFSKVFNYIINMISSSSVVV